MSGRHIIATGGAPDAADAPDAAAEVDEAVRAAAGAGVERSSRADGAGWLRALAVELELRRDELVALAHDETHLSETRLRGEVVRTATQLRFFADLIEEGSYLEATLDAPDASLVPPRPDLRRMLRPLGPVAVFAASNFPFAFSVLGNDTASALAAGCPVLLKANPSHPKLSAATGAHVSDALAEAGAPDGIFAVVMGFKTGTALIKDARIRAASFTGSLPAGRALFDLAASRPEPIPFYGELGSVNPAFVTPDAGAQLAEEVASGFVGSMSLGNGQFCTKPGLLFVPADSGLEDRVAALAGQRPASPMLSEHIRSGYSEALARLAERPGVRVIAGNASQEGDPAPTILAATVSDLLSDP